jgi:hypothetical protein
MQHATHYFRVVIHVTGGCLPHRLDRPDVGWVSGVDGLIATGTFGEWPILRRHHRRLGVGGGEAAGSFPAEGHAPPD